MSSESLPEISLGGIGIQAKDEAIVNVFNEVEKIIEVYDKEIASLKKQIELKTKKSPISSSNTLNCASKSSKSIDEMNLKSVDEFVIETLNSINIIGVNRGKVLSELLTCKNTEIEIICEKSNMSKKE